MKTLFPALLVSDVDVSVAFYSVLGYEVVGQVGAQQGTRLTMLALSGQAEVSLELVHRADASPADRSGLDHLAVQVDDLHLVPVLLGSGRRLFDHLDEPVELELVRTIHGRDATHLRYRVVRGS
ncbi:MAG TPA: VOC family protein [Microlunatus sp.]|nr:VOC family protein [Microlunatus sp.]